MFKCTGICSQCGRCKGSAMMQGANDRKTKILTYPQDFSPSCSGQGLGVAFDIGTTTVVGMLWDMATGTQLGSLARTNPQNEFGLDVISRISYCGKEGQKLPVLTGKIRGCLNEIVAALCLEAGRSSDEVTGAAICGNTTMSHIAGGRPPMSLAVAPFNPDYTGSLVLSPAEAELEMNPAGKVTIIPNIAGHVGGDITAGIVAARILDYEGLTVFIDIGTNGEIVFTDGKEAFACSTAAGPAFEGASIRHGMRAASGAIEKLMIQDGNVLFRTIGEVPPQGICGSGLIDAIAQMVKAKIIDKKGRIASAQDQAKRGFDIRLCQRLVSEGNERMFIIAEREGEDDIVITQNDVREVQLAKGAIKAGMKLMLGRVGKSFEDLDRVIVAGAFGSFIDRESAVAIGLLPDIGLEKIVSAGNTAGAGISMCLASPQEMELAERIPDLVQHIELAEDPDFQMTYMKSMGF